MSPDKRADVDSIALKNPEDCVVLGEGERYESIHMMAKRLRNQGVTKADAR